MVCEEKEAREAVERALETCRRKLRLEPDSRRLRIAEEQLLYLLCALDGGATDRIGEINLGLLAAREFEPDDFAFEMYDALKAKDFILYKKRV